MFSLYLCLARVLSGYFGFLQQSKDMWVRLTGDSKFPGVTVSVSGRLSVIDC